MQAIYFLLPLPLESLQAYRVGITDLLTINKNTAKRSLCISHSHFISFGFHSIWYSCSPVSGKEITFYLVLTFLSNRKPLRPHENTYLSLNLDCQTRHMERNSRFWKTEKQASVVYLPLSLSVYFTLYVVVEKICDMSSLTTN